MTCGQSISQTDRQKSHLSFQLIMAAHSEIFSVQAEENYLNYFFIR